eukprot:5506459-Pleurochrysis_carterae.AAC.1
MNRRRARPLTWTRLLRMHRQAKSAPDGGQKLRLVGPCMPGANLAAPRVGLSPHESASCPTSRPLAPRVGLLPHESTSGPPQFAQSVGSPGRCYLPTLAVTRSWSL